MIATMPSKSSRANRSQQDPAWNNSKTHLGSASIVYSQRRTPRVNYANSNKPAAVGAMPGDSPTALPMSRSTKSLPNNLLMCSRALRLWPARLRAATEACNSATRC
eukprot:1840825-Pyramimonas_sp.AAC.1